MPNLRGVGRESEDRAAEYLLSEGYTLVTRRFTTRYGELDLIALDGDTLVFIEVKARRAPDYLPEESVTQDKVQHLMKAAHAYLAEYPQDRPMRFDFIAIDRDGLRHYRDAFR